MENEKAISLKPLHEANVGDIVTLYQQNRSFLAPYEPTRSVVYFTEPGQLEIQQKAQDLWLNDTAYTFVICESATGELVGRVTLSNVARGAWQSCTIGYFISEKVNGRGYATEAVRLAVDFAFSQAGLHRVQAAIMPRNERSIRVIKKAGFIREGLARYYLNIHDVWEDHEIFSITRENWPL
ncbi:GNAT family N-acetyltransferase [Alicyclobacillus dauci]|uniref:GNAT family N-acetyltransferase n=1 Tax=Alicyclobacillus dauci TaxID=1475485 RepID=A0ABY6Z765_9BACL|nr:GNAT family protein [Alicyclobacillus dauci]WAH37850.1 GNAT family N-acetyltransferase [Alicyclobacillus dauci]